MTRCRSGLLASLVQDQAIGATSGVRIHNQRNQQFIAGEPGEVLSRAPHRAPEYLSRLIGGRTWMCRHVDQEGSVASVRLPDEALGEQRRRADAETER